MAIKSPFEERAGKPGYDDKGWRIVGMEATQDEERRRTQGQVIASRVARGNAKKAMRSGDMEGWLAWQDAAGGTTFGIQGAGQSQINSREAVDKQTQNAVGLNPSNRESRDALVPSVNQNTNQPSTSGNGDGSSPRNAAASSSGGEWVNIGPSATRGATTPPSGTGNSVIAAGTEDVFQKAKREEAEKRKALEADVAFGRPRGAFDDLVAGFKVGNKLEADKKAKAESDRQYAEAEASNQNDADEKTIEGWSPVMKDAYRQMPRQEQRRVLDEIAAKKSKASRTDDVADMLRRNNEKIASNLETNKQKSASDQAAIDAIGQRRDAAISEAQAREQEAKSAINERFRPDLRPVRDEAAKAVSEIRQGMINENLQTSAERGDVNSGRLFDGNWMEDPEIMPTPKQMDRYKDNPAKVREVVQVNINRRQAVDQAFNAELGGKDKTYSKGSKETYQAVSPTGDLIDVPRYHSEESYQKDAFSALKNTALGLRPNIAYEPNAKERADPSFSNKVSRAYSDMFMGTSGNPNDEMLVSMHREAPWYRDGNKQAEHVGKQIDKAQAKIVAAASKTNYPIWKDKELMADPAFRQRVMDDPKIGPKAKQYEAEKESKKSVAFYESNSKPGVSV